MKLVVGMSPDWNEYTPYLNGQQMSWSEVLEADDVAGTMVVMKLDADGVPDTDDDHVLSLATLTGDVQLVPKG